MEEKQLIEAIESAVEKAAEDLTKRLARVERLLKQEETWSKAYR